MKRTQGKDQDSLDRVLASDEELVPSSGFAASVMQRVREEVLVPEPIPFPWQRVMPGAVLVALGMLWCVVELVRLGVAEPADPAAMTLHHPALTTPQIASAGWVLAALATSLLSWLLARRLIERRGLV